MYPVPWATPDTLAVVKGFKRHHQSAHGNIGEEQQYQKCRQCHDYMRSVFPCVSKKLFHTFLHFKSIQPLRRKRSHSFYSVSYQSTVWEIVATDLPSKTAPGIIICSTIVDFGLSIRLINCLAATHPICSASCFTVVS